jgi:hypothetical protein
MRTDKVLTLINLKLQFEFNHLKKFETLIRSSQTKKMTAVFHFLKSRQPIFIQAS